LTTPAKTQKPPAANVDETTDLDSRIRAVERLTELFRVERLVYLSFAVISYLMLLVSLVFLLKHGEAPAVVGALGSSGAVAVTSSRVLNMWNRAMALVSGSAK